MRTVTLTQATARTTVATAILSTGPILVAMETSRSKPSCQAQREPAYRTEVRKQEWMEEAEGFIFVFLKSIQGYWNSAYLYSQISVLH